MSRPFHRHIAVALVALTLAQAHAQTCPFDTGGSDAINDGVVLTRYALGITGAPLTASTRYASLDPLQVKANIECVGCALDINGDSQVGTVDTTVIARHLAGFQGGIADRGFGARRRHAKHHRQRRELSCQRLCSRRRDQRLRARGQCVWRTCSHRHDRCPAGRRALGGGQRERVGECGE